jgi:hypothetical protein
METVLRTCSDHHLIRVSQVQLVASLDLRLAHRHPLVNQRQLPHSLRLAVSLAILVVHPALAILLRHHSLEEELRDPTQVREHQRLLSLETVREILLLEVGLESQLVRRAGQAHCLVEQLSLHPLVASPLVVKRRMKVERRHLQRTKRTRQEEHLPRAYSVVSQQDRICLEEVHQTMLLPLRQQDQQLQLRANPPSASVLLPHPPDLLLQIIVKHQSLLEAISSALLANKPHCSEPQKLRAQRKHLQAVPRCFPALLLLLVDFSA